MMYLLLHYKTATYLLELLAVGRSAVLTQHALAEERHLARIRGVHAMRVRCACGARRAVRVRCACGAVRVRCACGARATCSSSSPDALDISSPEITFLIQSSAAVFCLLVVKVHGSQVDSRCGSPEFGLQPAAVLVRRGASASKMRALSLSRRVDGAF